MNKVISRKIRKNDKIYRIQVTLKKISLSLLILEETEDEINAYETSMILDEELKKQADQRGIGVEIYYDKLVFFFENPEKANFTFDEGSLFISEKVNENIQAKYFHCDIHKVDNFSYFIGKFVDQMQETISETQENHFNLSENYNLIQGEVEEYKRKLIELVDRKNLDEQAMLSNFALLLNEKKRRIQHLNELLESYQSNPSLANPVRVNLSYKNKRKRINIKNEEPSSSRIVEKVSDSSLCSNDSYCTSDSENDKETSRVKSEVTVVGHSSSAVSNHSSGDDIFEEKPKPLPILPDISRQICDFIHVPTMMGDDCDRVQDDNIGKLKSAEGLSETKLLESKRFNSSFVDINTQDLVDGL